MGERFEPPERGNPQPSTTLSSSSKREQAYEKKKKHAAMHRNIERTPKRGGGDSVARKWET